jgi:hypothetical protein
MVIRRMLTGDPGDLTRSPKPPARAVIRRRSHARALSAA